MGIPSAASWSIVGCAGTVVAGPPRADDRRPGQQERRRNRLFHEAKNSAFAAHPTAAAAVIHEPSPPATFRTLRGQRRSCGHALWLWWRP
jgi:hypothetical protein